jgi:hypothetical protein
MPKIAAARSRFAPTGNDGNAESLKQVGVLCVRLQIATSCLRATHSMQNLRSLYLMPHTRSTAARAVLRTHRRISHRRDCLSRILSSASNHPEAKRLAHLVSPSTGKGQRATYGPGDLRTDAEERFGSEPT